ncbi:MAG: hypothetical protein COC19_00465 [SAR86 cluster bacterium]|uniref:YdhG-like domain-containing protein n=1 Tax=SAR86 cluster bacterium TaxID=2030880 RepID=A0A2A4MUW3_9GAMM|nr:MAG: hypothetical protein COC19_00465 [SAR86 cluster bacterium]
MDLLVKEVLDSYPENIRRKLMLIRQMIFEIAQEQLLDTPIETLKWGEPSYLTKKGSTVRLAFNAKQPLQYGVYFNCRTSLIETFKELYPSDFHYMTNRAIIFQVSQHIPISPLRHCLSLSLRYHSIKHLPLLGV